MAVSDRGSPLNPWLFLRDPDLKSEGWRQLNIDQPWWLGGIIL